MHEFVHEDAKSSSPIYRLIHENHARFAVELGMVSVLKGSKTHRS